MDPVIYHLDIKRGITYPGFALTATDEAGAPMALAGWKAYAQARKNADASLVHDLQPAIAVDDTVGIITIPAIAWQVTAGMPGNDVSYDLFLEDPAGVRYDPIVKGNVRIESTITQAS